FTVRIIWVHEKANDASLRHDFLKQLHSFGDRGGTEYGDTSGITARSVKARYQAFPDRVAIRGEYDRNCVGCILDDLRTRFAPKCGDYSDLSGYQIGSQLTQSIILTMRPTVLDRDVFTFDKALFL